MKASGLVKKSMKDCFSDIRYYEGNGGMYIEEKSQMHSLACLQVPANEVHVYKSGEKDRVFYCNTFDAPYTASSKVKPNPELGDCILCLGLARPWKGQYNQYEIPRCTIMVNGILQRV